MSQCGPAHQSPFQNLTGAESCSKVSSVKMQMIVGLSLYRAGRPLAAFEPGKKTEHVN